MSNDTLRNEILNLERKVKILLSEHTQLKEDAASILRENNELKEELKAKRAAISDFQNQSKISRIVDSMVVEGNSSVELKVVIDDYIKEIDKCIAHLGEA